MRRSRSDDPGGRSLPWWSSRRVAPVPVLVAWALALGPGASVARGQVAPAEDRTGASECCLVLLLPVGARAIALGRALTATATPEAVFANPAGLAGLEDSHFVVHHTNVAAQASAFSLLLTPSRIGTLGLSYELLDFGEIEHTDERGVTTGVLTLRHHVLVASFATELFGGFSTGLNYKLYQFRIGCRGSCGGEEVTATTHAIDAGFQFRPRTLPHVQFGAAVTNVGFPLQVINAQQADPLPVRARVGVAYEVLHHVRSQDLVEIWLAMDVVDEWSDAGSPTASLGIEVAAQDAIFLRAGYVPGDGVGTGAAVGVGVHYSRFSVSVAKSFASSPLEAAEEPVQFSFGLRF